MIEALIAGEQDPRVLADLARSVIRKKIPDLSMAYLFHRGFHPSASGRPH